MRDGQAVKSLGGVFAVEWEERRTGALFKNNKSTLLPMATLTDRLPGNAVGRYYVDSSCIDCDQCRAMAPEFFTRDAETGTSLIVRQPQTPEEIAGIEEVLTACAVSSIGNDGS